MDVDEVPEKGLGALERSGVVELLKRCGHRLDQRCDLGQHRPVDRVGDSIGSEWCRSRAGRRLISGIVAAVRRLVVALGEAEHEAAGVQHLQGQAAPHLHLRLVEGGVGAGPAVGGPVAHGVGAVLLEQLGRDDHVALRLGHLFAVGVEDPPGQRCVAPRRRALGQVAAHHGREQPGADDVVGLGPQVHRKHLGPQLVVVVPATGDLRGERRGGPRVHDVGVADEPVRLAPLRFVVAVRGVALGVDRKRDGVGRDRRVVVHLAVGVDRVPDRDRHAEVALAGDQPVAVEPLDPVGVAGLHVGRMPGHLVAACDQLLSQGGVATAVADVPLTALHDLERCLALLVELHRVLDHLRLAQQLAGGFQQLDRGALGGLHPETGQGLIRVPSGVGLDPCRGVGGKAPVATDDRPRRQVQLAPPDHVGQVAERADHGCAGALIGVGQAMGDHRHFNAEQRAGHRRAEQRFVPVIVGVGDQGNAADDQLGAGGADHQIALPVRAVKGQIVVGAGAGAILQLGL